MLIMELVALVALVAAVLVQLNSVYLLVSKEFRQTLKCRGKEASKHRGQLNRIESTSINST
jgi:hypothetical protein